jgi:hypothetical protein
VQTMDLVVASSTSNAMVMSYEMNHA